MELIFEPADNYLRRHKPFNQVRHLHDFFQRQGLDKYSMHAAHFLEFKDIVVFLNYPSDQPGNRVKVDWYNYYPARRGVAYTHSMSYLVDIELQEKKKDATRTLKSLIGLVYPDANLEGV